MVKFFCLIFCLIFAFGDSFTTNIECFYNKNADYAILSYIYQCQVNNNPNIISVESAQISTINGTHEGAKTNDDVLGFHATLKTIKIFPRGLHKIFKNLKAIYIYSSNLREVHQSNLRHFTNLVCIYLSNNEIEVIEEGLFEFNPNLEVIGFHESKIIHIDPNVFDHLDMISRLFLTSVPCFNQDVLFSKEKVKEAIKLLKIKCTSSEFLDLEEKIENLEVESKSLNFEAFNANLQSFEKSFKDSKFLNFRPLNERFENLKMIGKCSSCVQMEKMKTMDTKLDNLGGNFNDFLTNDLKNISGMFVDLKSSQCGLNDSLTAISSSYGNLESSLIELKSSQNKLEAILSGIKSSVNDHDSKISQLQKSQNQLGDSIDSAISDINTKIEDLLSLQNKLNNLATLEDKFVRFEEKLDNIEWNLMEFKAENAEKFDKIGNQIKNSRHKCSVNVDEKIKGLEKRLVKKFEEILEERSGNGADSKSDNENI